MMLRVLVLAGARQECPCCDVMVSGFCGLVLVGVFGFHSVFVFCRCFFIFSLFFSCFGVLFVYFLYAYGHLYAFCIFLYLPIKKKNILTLKNSSNIMFVIVFSSLILFRNNQSQICLRS